ncbi:UNVERIFIED_CONTAM: hypothetical protein Sradi_6442300 [Sesamum radiatum]|uniref:Uncharacterized protein n=1 Tax=Sesamum radiatum TaxID=300843 RepID=A0AAW2K3Y6_SESRA
MLKYEVLPVDVGPSSYGGDPYDYDEPRLTDHFYNIVHAADHPIWNGCTQSQLGVVAELVDIKADGHNFEQIYDRISQWANRILPPNRTLSGEYYNTKKLVNDLSLSVEKIDACKNDCMLHWKDDVDLGTTNFVGMLEGPHNVQLGLCTDGFAPHGVRTYDHATDNTFIMRVALMWTMNDLPAYGMAFG